MVFRAPRKLELFGNELKLKELLAACKERHVLDSRYRDLERWALKRFRNPCAVLSLEERAKAVMAEGIQPGSTLLDASEALCFTALVAAVGELYREEQGFTGLPPLPDCPRPGPRSRPSGLARLSA